MTTDLCGEDVVVRLSSSPQIISAESAAPACGGSEAAVIRGAAAPCGGVELGRRLLLAARAGDTGAVLELMAKGAPFSTDWLGTSPLHLAAANNHVETCAVLLRAGVSRDSRTKVERTPLHLAATAGHADVAALLLQHGAAPDCRDMLLMTPLHWAAARGQLAAARALLAAGADPRLRCKFRKTPRCLALRANRPDLVALLEAAEEAGVATLTPTERMIEEPLKLQQEIKNVQRVEIKPQAAMKLQPDKKITIESKTQAIPGGARLGRAEAAGGAAALLRAHGITLLPADRGSTVLTALRSGRTVVLSDAGKLMLKESIGEPPAPPARPPSAGDAPDGGGAADAGGRPERARPAKCAKGVKLLTLNKNQPLKRVIHPNDLQQVKLVRMPAVRPAAERPVADKPTARLRPALKIVLDKAHLSRLLATTRQAQLQASAPSPPAGDAAAEPASLRAQLAAARATIAELGAELRACRARLARYEGAP